MTWITLHHLNGEEFDISVDAITKLTLPHPNETGAGAKTVVWNGGGFDAVLESREDIRKLMRNDLGN